MGQLQRLTRFEARQPGDYTWTVVRLHGSAPVDRVAMPSRDRIIGVRGSDSARFSIFDRTGKHLRAVPAPLLGNDRIPREQRIRAMNCCITICERPRGLGFVIAYDNAGRVEYYEHEARLKWLAEVPYPSDVVFRQVPGSNRLEPYLPRFNYGQCTGTPDYLFVKYSGRLLTAYPAGQQRSEAEFVHVFDWEGRLVRVLRLDRPVGGITVDNGATTLYALTLGDAAIYRFPIPADALTPGARIIPERK